MTAKERKKDVLHAKCRYLLLIIQSVVTVVWSAAGLATCTHIIEVYKPTLASVTALAVALCASMFVPAAITIAARRWMQPPTSQGVHDVEASQPPAEGIEAADP